MDKARIEAKLCGFPISQYVWVRTADIPFSERIRYVCRTECPMYGRSWSCPPAVGSVAECMARCRRFDRALIISTVTEVNDIADLEETLKTRAFHEEITREIRSLLLEESPEVMVLSTEACSICGKCAYVDGLPCRHPERMLPCVESHGVVVTELAEKCGFERYEGNVVNWFSLLFFAE